MESHKPAKPNRQTIRLQDYDNSQAGAYFVTNCERGMQHKLGRVHNGEMEYSEIGQIAFDDFHWLEETFDLIEVDIFCIMPNHVHAIKSIIDPGRGDLQTAPTKRKPLGRIDGAYKTHTAVLINKHLNTPAQNSGSGIITNASSAINGNMTLSGNILMGTQPSGRKTGITATKQGKIYIHTTHRRTYPMTVLRPNAVKLYSFLSRLIHLQQQGEFPDNPRILDVGAGGPLPPLTIFYEQGFDCEGIDISATQLKNAEAYCQENKLDIHFQQGDMRAIPFEDQTFDCVYEQYAMCHLPKAGIQEAVNEMLRVTKPGGYCMLGFISMDSWPKSLFGPEQAPGEYLSVVEGDEGIHSMLTDEEADKFVSGWQIVNKEKVIRYSLESAKKPSLDDWAALKTDGYEGLSAAEWEERYPLRFQMYNYSHLFYILKKG